MPEIELPVNQYDLRTIDLLIELVKHSMEGMAIESRYVVAAKLYELLKPELDELERQVASGQLPTSS